jgi:hypothetical protein
VTDGRSTLKLEVEVEPPWLDAPALLDTGVWDMGARPALPAACIAAGVPLVHYERDYERIASVSALAGCCPMGRLAQLTNLSAVNLV